MKVILRESVPDLGEMGQLVSVKDGYARNYLLPRKLAVRADSGSAKQIEHEKRIIARREEKQRTALGALAGALGGVTVELSVRAGEEEKIFGSVTAQHIAEKLREQGYDVDRKRIALEEPIKTLGVYTVPVHLGSGIDANVKVWVSAQEEPT
ncbi:MAG TPA: 50S ribosomal protein L9 [Candidatus Hydrogenedentes bacterium]|nr:50S ribosomal protein L9 [Candidatus Hydrogenedentota bacterium]HIJ73303.1 50S ribosomal protein L9 [Candidatus Hydrogenedentota bacterium]